MKRYINMIAVLMVTLFGLSLTSCSDDDLKTGQYGGGVQLNVFGPSPVMRGGTLRFVGSNLNEISQVIIPGVPAITNIEVVKAGVPSEIRVTVPKDGPLPGIVTLITNRDQEIKTITPLAYSEPIEIAEIAPMSAMPGEVITIKGDYLNLIHMVEFADKVYVSEKDFKEHSRYEIKLEVPATAKTGKLGLYDFDITQISEEAQDKDVSYNIMMTDVALTVGTPSISSLASARTAKVDANGTVTTKAGDEVTIEGNYFGLVADVKFGDGDNVVSADTFMVSEDGKSIKVCVPASAPSGDITFVCRSTVEVPVGKIETIKPSELSAAPTPAKNGAVLTVSGKDVDLVVSASFPNVDDPASVSEVTGTSLKVIVPETAQEGDIALNMANGESVTVAYKLVKPTLVKYSANPVSAGAALTIEGTDLDLVASVSFAAAESAVAVTSEGTAINLTVPMDAESGKVTLNLKNGTSVEIAEIKIEEAKFCYAKTLPTEEDEIHAGQTMTINVANGDKLTEVQINGNKCQYILQGERLIVAVPDNAKKGATLMLLSSNGQISYKVDFIPNTEIKTVVWTGLEEYSNWGSSLNITNDKFNWGELTPGATLKATVTVDQKQDGWACLAIVGSNWSEQGRNQLNLDNGQHTLEILLDEEYINNIKSWGGLLFTGHNTILSRLEVVEHIKLEETLWEGSEDLGSWSAQPYIGAEDALINAGAKPGQILRLYGTPKGDGWCIQVFNGHWDGQIGEWKAESGIDPAKDGISIVLTEDNIGPLTNPIGWGGIFVTQGQDFIITKFTIE